MCLLCIASSTNILIRLYVFIRYRPLGPERAPRGRRDRRALASLTY